MSTDMRKEFEEYVKKLTTAICKEILLEKLENICSNYTKEYKNLLKTSESIRKTRNSLEETITNANDLVKMVELDSSNSMKNISDNIRALEYTIKVLFDDMRELNAQSKKEFIDDLSLYIERYKDEVAVTFKNGCDNISGSFEGIITPEQLQEFIDKLEENTRESKELAVFINDTYKAEVEKSIKDLVQENKFKQAEIYVSISEYIQKIYLELEDTVGNANEIMNKRTREFTEIIKNQLTAFSKYLVKLLEDEKQIRQKEINRQAELIKQIGPSDEKMDMWFDKVNDLEQIVKNLESQNKENNNYLIEILNYYMKEQKDLEQKRIANQELIEKRAENLSWKIYMAFSNTMLLALFLLLIFFQKPWEVFGLKNSLIIVTVFFVISIVVCSLRGIIAKMIVKRRAKKSTQLYK